MFKGLAADDKDTMDWCHGLKQHIVYNDRGEIITFCFTATNVDGRDSRVWAVPTRTLDGKLFTDRGYISSKLFDIQLGTGIRTNMRNRLMPVWHKIMLRRRYVIEAINDILKKTLPSWCIQGTGQSTTSS